MAKYTPMMEQYLEIKQEHKDAILFFRLGDFYEMFFDDAVLASRELEIVLTGRDGGDGKIPMCGIPYHAVNNYLPRLISRGYKVAICEQVEDPRQAAGIVKREVTRIITPGTVLEDFMLEEGNNNYLAAVDLDENRIGFAYIDVSTGDFRITEMQGPEAMNTLESELQRISPAECLISSRAGNNTLWDDELFGKNILRSSYPDAELNLDKAKSILYKHFGAESIAAFGLQDYSTALLAAAMIMDFIHTSCKNSLKHIDTITSYQTSNYMELDTFTRRNLELTSSLRQDRKEGTLLEVLDYCRTSMGKRTLKKWLQQPLMSLEAINQRLDGVEELLQNIELREACRDSLKKVYDLERLAAKLGSSLVNARDLLAVKHSLQVLPQLTLLLSNAKSSILQDIANLDPLDDVFQFIAAAVDEEAGISLKEGGIIKSGYRSDIDELKALSKEGKTWLIAFETREKEKSGIKNLKVGYNKVFGYYIEITKSNLNLVPQEYIRKQTLVNTERYINEELKNYENNILGARERLYELEYDCFVELRQMLEPYIPAIQKTAQTIADLDVLLSLAQAAYLNDYVRPVLNRDGKLEIKAGRHPVVEKSLNDKRFVPNDIRMDMQESRFAIITGPNMGGKSTYMRQAAIISIMAQTGSFVPAAEARISLVDRVFTRVGASDDLSAGQSTFMVEMLELANILHCATPDSLVILDEIGRGTSTYDGLSIAQAVSEFLHDRIKAKTLFATHYHELTCLADQKEGIMNLSVSVLETGETVSFLKKVLPGKADKSYGIHVAQMAGLPKQVIDRAYELLAELEREKSKAPVRMVEQINLFQESPNEILDELGQLDIDSLSPREALEILYRWQSRHRPKG